MERPIPTRVLTNVFRHESTSAEAEFLASNRVEAVGPKLAYEMFMGEFEILFPEEKS